MIETTFLNILDNLVKLKQFKSDSDRKLFENHIAPIYNDSRTIIDNYHEILRDVQAKLKETDFSQTSTHTIILMLVQRREEHERIRGEVKKYSKTLTRGNYSKDIQIFATAVFNLLNIEPVTTEMIQCFMLKPHPKTKTATTSLIWDLSKVLEANSNSQKAALSLVKHYIKEIDEHWDTVSESYFELRAKYLR